MRPAQLIPILETEFLSAAEGHHTPVMMWGPPGVGKSQMVSEVAARHQVPVIDIRLSQMEPSDLRGIPFRVGDHVDWAIPSILPDAGRHGEKGILFLDEITSAPPSVSAAAYQLILDRRLGAYVVPPGWAIFAAGNRQGDRGVTYAMPAPLANRFSHFDVEANLDDWSRWAYENNIDARLIGFLRFRPELLFDFDPARNPTAFPTPRSWEFAHRALQKFSDQPDLLGPALAAASAQHARYLPAQRAGFDATFHRDPASTAAGAASRRSGMAEPRVRLVHRVRADGRVHALVHRPHDRGPAGRTHQGRPRPHRH